MTEPVVPRKEASRIAGEALWLVGERGAEAIELALRAAEEAAAIREAQAQEPEQRAALDSAVTAARKAERERCAKVCEVINSRFQMRESYSPALACADAIRAMGEE